MVQSYTIKVREMALRAPPGRDQQTVANGHKHLGWEAEIVGFPEKMSPLVIF